MNRGMWNMTLVNGWRNGANSKRGSKVFEAVCWLSEICRGTWKLWGGEMFQTLLWNEAISLCPSNRSDRLTLTIIVSSLVNSSKPHCLRLREEDHAIERKLIILSFPAPFINGFKFVFLVKPSGLEYYTIYYCCKFWQKLIAHGNTEIVRETISNYLGSSSI